MSAEVLSFRVHRANAWYSAGGATVKASQYHTDIPA